MKDWNRIVGTAGLIVICYAILSAIFEKNPFWYSYFVIGGTLMVGYLNDRLGNASILQALAMDRTKVFLSYGVCLIAAAGIEFFGRFIFGLWEYPTLRPIDLVVHLTLFQYSIGFFYLYESLVLVQTRMKSIVLAVGIVSLMNGLFIEVLNSVAPEWKYHIPFISNEILQIVTAATFGWIFMTCVSIWINNFAPLRYPKRQSGHEGNA